MDFVNNKKAFKKMGPFAMFVIEFTQDLSKQDLANMWQGLMPKPARGGKGLKDTQKAHVGIGQFEMLNQESILADEWDKLRWMVFKVKQRALYDYGKLTMDAKDDGKFKTPFKLDGQENELAYSYNWPYDFCTIIEMVKLQASPKITFARPAAKYVFSQRSGVSTIDLAQEETKQTVREIIKEGGILKTAVDIEGNALLKKEEIIQKFEKRHGDDPIIA
tara:strand:- start:149 stop:805 length:657 start_codon:yes stop_codon:yes gene_type:complete